MNFKDKGWKEGRIGYCKKCGVFGRVYGGETFRLCSNCLDEWNKEQVKKFLQHSGGKTFILLKDLLDHEEKT